MICKYMWTNANTKNVEDYLKCEADVKSGLIGFDGFVDEIHRIVSKIEGDKKDFCRTIPDFADKIYNAAGFSTNVEMLRQAKKLGGNAPIMAASMISLGSQLHFC